jgi:hypothetical protein
MFARFAVWRDPFLTLLLIRCIRLFLLLSLALCSVTQPHKLPWHWLPCTTLTKKGRRQSLTRTFLRVSSSKSTENTNSTISIELDFRRILTRMIQLVRILLATILESFVLPRNTTMNLRRKWYACFLRKIYWLFSTYKVADRLTIASLTITG